MDKKLIFFDLDGTLSSPEYRYNGQPVIGFPTIESWITYCKKMGKNAYQYCKPMEPVKRYAIERKQECALLYVLTVVMSDAEIEAKKVFIKKHYDGLFEEIITVRNAEDKVRIILEMATEKGVAANDCEMVEDTYMTLMDILGNNIKATHISSIVCDL